MILDVINRGIEVQNSLDKIFTKDYSDGRVIVQERLGIRPSLDN